MLVRTHLIFGDESGDASMRRTHPAFPVLALAMCIFEESAYDAVVVPAMRDLKKQYLGDESIVLHERDIRRNQGQFATIGGKARREEFERTLVDALDSLPFTIIAVVIDKVRLKERYPHPDDPYSLCLRFGLERVRMHLNKTGHRGMVARLQAESRGEREDQRLRASFNAFRRGDYLGAPLERVELEFAGKHEGHAGMEIADLVANPIARYVLRRPQPLIPFEVIEPKLDRNRWGQTAGRGLKVFP